MTSPAPPLNAACLPHVAGRVSGPINAASAAGVPAANLARGAAPINDCGTPIASGGTESQRAYVCTVLGASVRNPAHRRLATGPQSPISKPVKSSPTVAVLAKAGASINALGGVDSVCPTRTPRESKATAEPTKATARGLVSSWCNSNPSAPPELTALSLALIGPVVCVAVMWVLAR